MLCPKGIRRYLQGSHPDRLLHAYRRDPSADGGFRPVPYEEAIRLVASEIERIQSAYGRDAFAVMGGASLTIEKTYLMGKFTRVCLKSRHIDYNGRLCMVSAAAANKKALGIDRSSNPWSDILHAEVVWISGANVAECAPITTHYVWQARESGGKVIVADPRITPIARTCDLFLPVKPGRDVALFNGVLHLMIENGWLDHEFIANHTVGFDKVAEHVRSWTPRRTAEVTGVAEHAIRKAAELWGTARTSFLMHARGIEHHTHGVQNVLSAINIVLASGRIGRESCGYATITGQANGQGGREHGQKCDQLPGARHREPGASRPHREGLGHRRGGAAPRRGRCVRDHAAHRPGGDQGAPDHLLQPHGVAPRQPLRHPGAGEAGVLRRDRPVPERVGPARGRRSPGLLARGGRGDRDQLRGAGHPGE
jgi:assimilatory nitrate reductase catalytic subunit